MIDIGGGSTEYVVGRPGQDPGFHVSTQIGVVRHIHLSHGPAIYERTAVSTDIRHLVCESCGRHVAVPKRVFDTARRTLERDYGFVLDGSHFAIVGRCRECADRE